MDGKRPPRHERRGPEEREARTSSKGKLHQKSALGVKKQSSDRSVLSLEEKSSSKEKEIDQKRRKRREDTDQIKMTEINYKEEKNSKRVTEDNDKRRRREKAEEMRKKEIVKSHTEQKTRRSSKEKLDDDKRRKRKEDVDPMQSKEAVNYRDDKAKRSSKERDDIDKRRVRKDDDRILSKESEKRFKEKKNRHHQRRDADRGRYDENRKSYREKEEPHEYKRDHIEQRSHKVTSNSEDSEKSTAQRTNDDITKLHNSTEIINEYDYDDDEFEDYEDDFESEMDDSSDASLHYNDDQSSRNQVFETETLKLKEAIKLENARASSVSPILPSSPANTPEDIRRPNKNLRVLDFTTARRHQASSKSVKRSKYLTNLIELDYVYFGLLELKPQTEYEIYMKSFGRANTQQQYTQSNDDYLDKEVTTEPCDSKTCWTQHPAESSVAVCHEDEENVDDDDKLGKFNPKTLQKFMAVSSRIVITLLEERASRHGYSSTFKTESESKLSDRYASYQPHYISASRTPVSIVSVSSEMFVVTYTKPKSQSKLKYPGLSCLWSLQNIEEPLHVLAGNGLQKCCCVSRHNPNLIFTGNDDGSIYLYDLNEPADFHGHIEGPNNSTVTVRLPTYNTSGIQLAESHVSKVTSLQILEVDRNTDKAHASAFQIASLDENGTIIIWVVINLAEDTLSGSQTDLGLRPGGKIKLVKSAIVTTASPDADISSFRTFSFHQQITDTNTFFVATDTGSVYKTSRIKTIAHPHTYSDDLGIPAIIGSMSFNKYNWKYFLTGSSNGVVSLYYVNRSNPVVIWNRTTRGRPIRHIEWSKYSSTIFYVMDSANKFYFWDLSVRDSTPVIIQSFEQKGLMAFSELAAYSGSESPTIVFCFKDGSLEAHHIKPIAMNNKENNIKKLQSYITSIL